MYESGGQLLATHSHRLPDTISDEQTPHHETTVLRYPGRLDHDPSWGIMSPGEAWVLERMPWVEGYSGTHTWRTPDITLSMAPALSPTFTAVYWH